MNAVREFHRWYDRLGHWVYDTREEAAATWLKWGIKCLQPAPRNATIESIITQKP